MLRKSDLAGAAALLRMVRIILAESTHCAWKPQCVVVSCEAQECFLQEGLGKFGNECRP